MVKIITADRMLQPSSQRLFVVISGLFCLAVSFNGAARESLLLGSPTNAPMQNRNWHGRNADIAFAGVRLWSGVEAHMPSTGIASRCRSSAQDSTGNFNKSIQQHE
jgi:hypothetical protein